MPSYTGPIGCLHMCRPVPVFVMGWASPWAMGWAVIGSGLGWNVKETNGLWMGLGLKYEIV